MIDHLGLKVADADKSRHFYDAALAPIGYTMLIELPKQWTGGATVLGYGPGPVPEFWITGPASGTPVHVAFRVEDRQQVDKFFQQALAAGGTDNGPPGLRSHYHKDYYAAFVLDPDGNNIEVVCHVPQEPNQAFQE